jgi:hypothetical protein
MELNARQTAATNFQPLNQFPEAPILPGFVTQNAPVIPREAGE